ncbi:MAG: class I SAM-dependent methyltransferase [Rhodospirillales bacterium]|nr:MAG: class I SAM-dependent methyltransferase [Rhodospirillales bacterium]
MNAVTVGPSRYQTWRSTWLGQITERLEQELLLELADPVNGQDVLDLGCGDGVLTEKLLDHGAKVTGLDADPDMIAAARVSLPGVDFRPGNACHLPFSDASFDLITANTLLCLVRDRQDILAEAARVLRPGARLVIGELNRFSLWALIRTSP